MGAKIFNFESKLPEVLYLDSSFIINFSIDGSRYFKDCAAFSKRLVNNKVTMITSNLTLDEIWYVFIRVTLSETFGKNWRTKLEKEPETLDKTIPILKRATTDLLMIQNLIIVEINTPSYWGHWISWKNTGCFHEMLSTLQQ